MMRKKLLLNLDKKRPLGDADRQRAPRRDLTNGYCCVTVIGQVFYDGVKAIGEAPVKDGCFNGL